jgi:hypothetical protein
LSFLISVRTLLWPIGSRAVHFQAKVVISQMRKLQPGGRIIVDSGPSHGSSRAGTRTHSHEVWSHPLYQALMTSLVFQAFPSKKHEAEPLGVTAQASPSHTQAYSEPPMIKDKSCVRRHLPQTSSYDGM